MGVDVPEDTMTVDIGSAFERNVHMHDVTGDGGSAESHHNKPCCNMADGTSWCRAQ